MNDEKQALVPRLRFPEFREAGEWEEKPLGKLGQIITGKTPSTKNSELWGSGIPFITPTDMSEDIKYQKTTARKVLKTKDIKVLPKGSIVYTCIASIGKMALTVCESTTNQQINSVVVHPDTNNEFVFYALSNLTPWIKTIPASSTLAIINKTEFSGVPIKLPNTKNEQQKIADCLSSLDALIAAQADKLDALKTHKKGLMQQLFPREGETVPRLRFPEFREAGEWEMVPLGKYYGNIRNGFVGTATPHYVANGIPYLQGKNIKQGRIDATGMVNISSSFHQAHKKSKLCIGDILMVQSGHVGECAMVEQQFSDGNCHALIVLSPEVDVHSAFFVHYFYSPLGCSQIFEITTGNTIKHILASDVRSLNVCVPKLAEQQKIAACLSSLDALIAAQADKLDALKTHKKGLMQQLFPSPEA